MQQKDITGFNGQYVIFSDGRVWSNPQTLPGKNGTYRNVKGRFLRQHIQNSVLLKYLKWKEIKQNDTKRKGLFKNARRKEKLDR